MAPPRRRPLSALSRAAWMGAGAAVAVAAAAATAAAREQEVYSAGGVAYTAATAAAVPTGSGGILCAMGAESGGPRWLRTRVYHPSIFTPRGPPVC